MRPNKNASYAFKIRNKKLHPHHAVYIIMILQEFNDYVNKVATVQCTIEQQKWWTTT